LFDPTTNAEYIPIDPAAVPYAFRIKLWDRTYGLHVRWNDIGKFYTVDLYDNNELPLVYGDPVRYGRPMFGAVEDERFPLPVIIPYAKPGNSIGVVTQNNLGTDVKLWLYERWT